MKQTLMIITLISLLFSCKKEDNYPDYPVRLISTQYQVITYPKVYTKSGEITDQTTIANYISASTTNYFYMNSNAIITAPNDTITYKSRDSVVFSTDNWGTRIAKSSGQYIYFNMSDTLMGYKRMNNVLNNIAENIGIVKPYYKDACPPPYCPFELVYDAFIATGSQQQLEFPLLTYKITRGGNASFTGLTRKNYNNVFDKSVLNLLQDKDTLAVQILKRIYKK